MFNKWAGEGRWEVGEEAELHLQQYILTVKDKPTGLKDKESLKLRIELLTRSVQRDSTVMAISHLAKSLAYKGHLEKVKEQMALWETCRQAKIDGYLWLFNQVDLDLVKPDNLAWQPRSHNQMGAWQ